MEVISYPTGKKIKYNDLTLRIIASFAAAHIVTEFGGNEPWLSRLLTGMYYIEFGTTLVITLLLVCYIYRCTCYLDVRLGWHEKPLKRGILQFIFGVICPTLGAFFLAALYFAYFGVNILKTNYHLYALPFIAALITLFNAYYLVYYLLAESKYYKAIAGTALDTSGSQTYDTETSKEVFIVHTLTKSFPVQTGDIAYFFRDNGHVLLRLFHGADHLLSQSLDQIEKQLDGQDFLRVARHMIISHKAVVSFMPLTFGKIGVTLNPPYKEQVSASKLLARNFRLWMDR
ncbi:LytTR family DNA-binding domain-containing protein [Pedobacter borealis]|uniref:LytTR family DNA-binding domain-containing protein n=1 Tax=Pedobacter borealis TaxID=475254 RepID=UPI000493B154|nr:LytTR family DNA-binding domain-containing protein [Pedobacter borealis]